MLENPEGSEADFPGTSKTRAMQTPMFGKERLGALSDGVFAISMTLLVLNLRLPDTAAVPLDITIGWMLPKLDNWLISFLVTGALWIMHHHALGDLQRTDTLFLWINLLFLLLISFMPYPTALVGLYAEQPKAVILFSGSVGLAGLLLIGLWLYATHRGRLIAEDLTREHRRFTLLLMARVPVVALISILLAPLHPRLALYSWGLVTVFGVVFRHHHRLA